MGRLQIPLGYSTRPIGPVLPSTSSDFYGNAALCDQSVVSIAEIERINKERRQAYNGALAEYESAIYRFKSQKTQPHN